MKQDFYFILVLMVCTISTGAEGYSFLYTGIPTITEAGLSQTNSIGTNSILWNPANLTLIPAGGKGPENQSKKKKHEKPLSGIELYGDISLLSLQYTYARSGYEPVRIAMTAPPVTFGASWRPQPKLAFGAIFQPVPPSKKKGLTVEKVPANISGEVLIIDMYGLPGGGSVVSGFGIGINPNSRFSIGLSVIESASTTQTEVRIHGSNPSDPPLQQTSSSTHSIQYLIGIRSQFDETTLLAASLKPSVVVQSPSLTSTLGSTAEAKTTASYLPMEFAIGVEKALGSQEFLGEYRRIGWAAGNSVVKTNLAGPIGSAGYQDVNVFIVGGRHKFSPTDTVSIALGIYPPNVGLGSQLNANGTPADGGPITGGVTIGGFDGLSRQVFAGGYKMQKRHSYIQAGANIQFASRDVPSGYSFEGSHKLSVYQFAVGGGRSF
jgi:hypothetical protein